MMKRHATLAAVAAGLALIVGAGVLTAQAAIPDANDVIHGCISRSGALRLIDTEAGQTCTNRERPVSWSARSGDLSQLDLAVILGSNDFSGFDGGPRPDNNPSEFVLQCPDGEFAISGGYSLTVQPSTGDNFVTLTNGVHVLGSNRFGDDWKITVFSSGPQYRLNTHVQCARFYRAQ
jgi:hypothetical protein